MDRTISLSVHVLSLSLREKAQYNFPHLAGTVSDTASIQAHYFTGYAERKNGKRNEILPQRLHCPCGRSVLTHNVPIYIIFFLQYQKGKKWSQTRMLLLNIDLLYAWKHHTPSRPNCSCETLEMKHSIQHSLQNYEKNYTWICIKIALKIHYTCKYSATIENLLIYILAHTVCTCTLAFYCETKKNSIHI